MLHTYACMYVFTHVCVCVYVCMHVYVCVYVHTCSSHLGRRFFLWHAFWDLCRTQTHEIEHGKQPVVLSQHMPKDGGCTCGQLGLECGCGGASTFGESFCFSCRGRCVCSEPCFNVQDTLIQLLRGHVALSLRRRIHRKLLSIGFFFEIDSSKKKLQTSKWEDTKKKIRNSIVVISLYGCAVS